MGTTHNGRFVSISGARVQVPVVLSATASCRDSHGAWYLGPCCLLEDLHWVPGSWLGSKPPPTVYLGSKPVWIYCSLPLNLNFSSICRKMENETISLKKFLKILSIFLTVYIFYKVFEGPCISNKVSFHASFSMLMTLQLCFTDCFFSQSYLQFRKQ